jgi:hypothetical protein
MVANRECRDAIVGIGDDPAAGRKLGHAHAMRISFGAEPRFDLAQRLGMTLQGHIQRRRRRLTRVIVGRGADSAEAEDEIAARESAAQDVGQARAIVARYCA